MDHGTRRLQIDSSMQPTLLTPLHRSTLFEMMPLPAFVKGIDLAYTHANRAYCTLLGCLREDLVGRLAAEVDVADAASHEDADRRLLADGGTITHGFHLPGRAIEAVRGDVFKMRLDDADGTPVGLLGVIIDRTVQLDSERRLLEAETLHRVVLESISDAVLMLDAYGRITFVTPKVATIFGIGPAEAIARGTLDQLFGVPESPVAALLCGREIANVECIVVWPDGSRRDLLVNSKPIQFGPSRWLVTCHDVTQRMEAENRLKGSMVRTIQALCTTVEQRDPYVVGHQARVAGLAVAIGRRMGLDDDRLEGLRLAAIVHDIGKVNVPIEILSKPGKLTGPEFEIIQTHVAAGYRILKDIDFPWPIARMVHEHHEAMDGSGYPQGLAGDQILQESRILSVADVLEAVTSHRPYRAGLGLDKGLEVLREMRGRKLDPEAVDVCIALIESEEVSVPGWNTAGDTAEKR